MKLKPKTENVNQCKCSSCILSRKIRRHFTGMTKAQKEIIDELWSRMEAAEMELDVIQARKDGSWPGAENN